MREGGGRGQGERNGHPLPISSVTIKESSRLIKLLLLKILLWSLLAKDFVLGHHRQLLATLMIERIRLGM